MQRRYENATSLYMVTCCLTSNLNIYLCAQPFNCLEHILKDQQSCMCLSLEILCLHNNILMCPQPYNFCTYKSILHGLVPCKHLQIIVFYMPPNSSVQQIRNVYMEQLLVNYFLHFSWAPREERASMSPKIHTALWSPTQRLSWLRADQLCPASTSNPNIKKISTPPYLVDCAPSQHPRFFRCL